MAADCSNQWNMMGSEHKIGLQWEFRGIHFVQKKDVRATLKWVWNIK
jgi:hypothetical protein